jgi:hypothetical protein
MALVSLLFLGTIVLNVAGISSMLSFVFLWASVFVCGFLHMFVGLYAARADKSLYRALLNVPRYAMWKALVYAKLIRHGRTNEWIRTTREPEIAHEESAKA